MQQNAKPAGCVMIYGMCLILLTSTCCVTHSAEGKSHFTVYIFVSLHDYSLKVIKYCKLHKSGEDGEGAGDERKGSSASVFEVANANGPNDLTRGKCEFLSAAICRWKKRSTKFFFYWMGPFTIPQNATLSDI